MCPITFSFRYDPENPSFQEHCSQCAERASISTFLGLIAFAKRGRSCRAGHIQVAPEREPRSKTPATAAGIYRARDLAGLSVPVAPQPSSAYASHHRGDGVRIGARKDTAPFPTRARHDHRSPVRRTSWRTIGCRIAELGIVVPESPFLPRRCQLLCLRIDSPERCPCGRQRRGCGQRTKECGFGPRSGPGLRGRARAGRHGSASGRVRKRERVGHDPRGCDRGGDATSDDRGVPCANAAYSRVLPPHTDTG